MSTTPKPLTGAQRVARVNEGKIAAGLTEVRSLWAYKEDIPAIRAYAKALTDAETAKRERAAKKAVKGKP